MCCVLSDRAYRPSGHREKWKTPVSREKMRATSDAIRAPVYGNTESRFSAALRRLRQWCASKDGSRGEATEQAEKKGPAHAGNTRVGEQWQRQRGRDQGQAAAAAQPQEEVQGAPRGGGHRRRIRHSWIQELWGSRGRCQLPATAFCSRRGCQAGRTVAVQRATVLRSYRVVLSKNGRTKRKISAEKRWNVAHFLISCFLKARD